ncbi:MAG TPA: pilus assembly protein CpaE [Allosphingosinicella sp.]|uniref:AAA family ATPase n=1 Tax=Allosphingosinicella sp. TaxID=2823234 RepID=UPI002ED944F5
MNPSPVSLPIWRPHKKGLLVDVLLSADGMAASDQPDPELNGFDLRPSLLDDNAPIASQLMPGAQAVIVEVKKESRASSAALNKLIADAPGLPVIAAVHSPSLADMRNLMRLGVTDVVPLPLNATDLVEALERLRTDIEARGEAGGSRGRLVSIVKSVGGVGATALLTQIAAIHAAGAGDGRETCLIDLDIQLGSASLYLGALPPLGMKDLLDAGSRADGALLRSVTAKHSSGLHFVAAPQEMMPMEAVGSDQMIALLDLATREFDTVFIDLPTNWTNWSFSALARSDAILLVSELSIASLRQARRQIELIEQQGLSNIPLHVVMNRVEKRLFRTIDFNDAARALGRDVAFTVTNDFETMSTALDRGVTVSSINKRSRIAKDLGAIAGALSQTATRRAG